MGGVYCVIGKEEECIQEFCSKPKHRVCFEDLCVNGRIMLKRGVQIMNPS